MSDQIRRLVGRHADNLEAASAALAKDNLGLADRTGHVAVLKRMASDLRAQAARGIMPHSFGDSGMYASGAPLSQQVTAAIRSVGLDRLMASADTISADDLTATFVSEDTPVSDRMMVRHALAACGKLTG